MENLLVVQNENYGENDFNSFEEIETTPLNKKEKLEKYPFTPKPKEIAKDDFFKIMVASSKYPTHKEIYQRTLEQLHKITNLEINTKFYTSNCSVLESEDITSSRFQIEFLTPFKVRENSSNLSLLITLEYKNNESLMLNLAYQEHVLVCSNGLIVPKNVLEQRSSFTKKYGIDRLLNTFVNEFSINDSIKNLEEFYNNTQFLLSKEKEKEILGDMLQKLHTKNHVVDSNILILAAKYANDKNNEFYSEQERTGYEFMQDFTKFMTTTEISKHIDKHTKLSEYFEEIPKNFL